MMFVGRHLVLRDIFQHISKFSLFAQTVNVLPWELRDAEDALLASLKEIYRAADASDGATGSLLQQYFPLLYADGTWDGLQQGRFKGIDSNLPWVGDDEGTPKEPGERYSLDQFPSLLIDEVHDFVKALHHFMVIRSVDCKGAPRQSQGDSRGGHQFDVPGGKEARALVELMGDCLDLRKLCVEPCPLVGREGALRDIYAAATGAGVDLAPLTVLTAQLETLRLRLVAAADGDFKKRWFHGDGGLGCIKSGTVIMKSVFTDRKLHSDIGDILYLFQHCALKTRNEVVVEGIGSIVNMHADGRRGLSANGYEKEAFIHYNGPPLAKADGIIRGALDIHFEGKKWHFEKDSYEAQRRFLGSVSQVIERHKDNLGKLPFSEKSFFS